MGREVQIRIPISFSRISQYTPGGGEGPADRDQRLRISCPISVTGPLEIRAPFALALPRERCVASDSFRSIVIFDLSLLLAYVCEICEANLVHRTR